MKVANPPSNSSMSYEEILPELEKQQAIDLMSTTMPPNTKKCERRVCQYCQVYGINYSCHTPPPEKEKCKSCNDFGFWTDSSGKPYKCNEASHTKPTPAVEDWEEKLKVMILSRGMGVSLNDCVNYVRSLRESDRKRILKWAEKEKRHDILYFSDLVAFITNLK